MLTAAMILGLIGGLAYFIGGGAEAILTHENGESIPWWVISLIPIGVIGAIGGAMVRWKPSYAGFLLLLAGVAAIAIGFVSYEEFVLEYQQYAVPLPAHPFMCWIFYLPLPLFALIIAGVLALTGRKEVES